MGLFRKFQKIWASHESHGSLATDHGSLNALSSSFDELKAKMIRVRELTFEFVLSSWTYFHEWTSLVLNFIFSCVRSTIFGGFCATGAIFVGGGALSRFGGVFWGIYF